MELLNENGNSVNLEEKTMNSNDNNNTIMNTHHSNNSIMLGQFFPASLFQSSASLRRLTSASSDSGDSGVDPVIKLKELFSYSKCVE